jgi:hypothetical protein
MGFGGGGAAAAAATFAASTFASLLALAAAKRSTAALTEAAFGTIFSTTGFTIAAAFTALDFVGALAFTAGLTFAAGLAAAFAAGFTTLAAAFAGAFTALAAGFFAGTLDVVVFTILIAFARRYVAHLASRVTREKIPSFMGSGLCSVCLCFLHKKTLAQI